MPQMRRVPQRSLAFHRLRGGSSPLPACGERSNAKRSGEGALPQAQTRRYAPSSGSLSLATFSPQAGRRKQASSSPRAARAELHQSPPENVRGGGAPKGASNIFSAATGPPGESLPAAIGRAARTAWRDGLRTRRLSALHRGDFGPRDHARRPDKSSRSVDPAGFRPRSSDRVLPLKAAPRNGGGRRPGASRDVGASHTAGAASRSVCRHASGGALAERD
jgi:hypothetical protein